MSILRTLPRSFAPALARRAASTSASPSITVNSTRSNASAPILANIEASWKSLPAEEQYEVYQQLEEIQKKDWKELTIDEKKAAYFVAFGPHGPRAPYNPPNNTIKVVLGTGAAIAAAILIMGGVKSIAPPPVRTNNEEYKQQSTEYLKGQNANPISGLSSEGYKGKGMIG